MITASSAVTKSSGLELALSAIDELDNSALTAFRMMVVNSSALVRIIFSDMISFDLMHQRSTGANHVQSETGTRNRLQPVAIYI